MAKVDCACAGVFRNADPWVLNASAQAGRIWTHLPALVAGNTLTAARMLQSIEQQSPAGPVPPPTRPEGSPACVCPARSAWPAACSCPLLPVPARSAVLTACSCPFLSRPLCPALSAPALPCRLLPLPLCPPPAPARSCPLCQALSALALPAPALPALPVPARSARSARPCPPAGGWSCCRRRRLPRQERRAETSRARPGSSGDGHRFVRVPKAPTRDQTRTSSECLCARRRRDRAGDQGLQKSWFPFPLQPWVTLGKVLLLYPENRELSCSLGLYIC